MAFINLGALGLRSRLLCTSLHMINKPPLFLSIFKPQPLSFVHKSTHQNVLPRRARVLHGQQPSRPVPETNRRRHITAARPSHISSTTTPQRLPLAARRPRRCSLPRLRTRRPTNGRGTTQQSYAFRTNASKSKWWRNTQLGRRVRAATTAFCTGGVCSAEA